MMLIKKYEYAGYMLELHEHPIYHDFEYVIKSLDEHQVFGASSHPYEYFEDAEKAALILINTL